MSRQLATSRKTLAPRHGSRSEHVYRRLRDAIQQGEFKSGRRVMEIEVAEWLKVSRTPVRDAIRRLESEGMLEHEPRNGVVVARIDRKARSEERRVGKECRSRWSPDH